MPDPGRLLFVASEVYPLIKTGGLADVAGSLPPVLQQEGMDVRILLPAYRDVLDKTGPLAEILRFELAGEEVAVLETSLPGTRVTTWLLSHASFTGGTRNNGYSRPACFMVSFHTASFFRSCIVCSMLLLNTSHVVSIASLS